MIKARKGLPWKAHLLADAVFVLSVAKNFWTKCSRMSRVCFRFGTAIYPDNLTSVDRYVLRQPIKQEKIFLPFLLPIFPIGFHSFIFVSVYFCFCFFRTRRTLRHLFRCAVLAGLSGNGVGDRLSIFPSVHCVKTFSLF